MIQLPLFAEIKSDFPTYKQSLTPQKLRGGYYTPPKLAHYLVKWGIHNQTKRILEPSCGDGNFVQTILSCLETRPEITPDIVAIELIEAEIEKAKQRSSLLLPYAQQVEWICQDFFTAYALLKEREPFDLIIGNPPFIRFQAFSDISREVAFHHLREAGYRPTKLANAWAAFVQLSVELLGENGRLAMVLPGELLQVKYAHELRERLASQFKHIVIVGFKRLVFPDIQQEVVLLLADGKQTAASTTLSAIHTLELTDDNELAALNNLDEAIAHKPAKHTRKGMKWTSLFLDQANFHILDKTQQNPKLTRLGDLASVDVGIVTGQNSFFILDQAQKTELKAEMFVRPIIGRTFALKTISFTEDDFAEYIKQYPAFLLDLNNNYYDSLPQGLKDYLCEGERQGIHHGYKCRIRKQWYGIPSIWVPDAFLFRQIHRYPLLVINEAGVTATDTIHRVQVHKGIRKRLLAATFFNSLTLAWTEVSGRSYGGGVLELEPREAEDLPIPYSENIGLDIEKVELLLQRGDFMGALSYVDTIVLEGYLGLDKLSVCQLRSAWEQLRDRRIERK